MSDKIEHKDLEVDVHVLVFNNDRYNTTQGKEYPIKFIYEDYEEVGFIDDHGIPSLVWLGDDDYDNDVVVKEGSPESMQLRKEFKALLEDSESQIGVINASLKEHGMQVKLCPTGQEEVSVDWYSSSIGC